MFLAQLNKVKGVEVTGSNLDSLSKFIKSDVTAFTETMSIGFTAKNYKIVDSLDEIKAMGHRIVQGGSYFDKSVVVDDDVMSKIEELAPLAPLHNPAALVGIRAALEVFPNGGTDEAAMACHINFSIFLHTAKSFYRGRVDGF